MISAQVQRPPGREEAGAPNAVPDNDRSADHGVVDSPPPLTEDGVISDARRRVRRRRIGYAIAAVLAVGVGAFAMFSGPATAPELGADDGDASGVGAASSADAEIVSQWSKIHVGWVFVYGDGRVLVYPDGGEEIFEHRLSTIGLALVRRGELAPKSFLVNLGEIPRPALSGREAHDYRADRHAVCLSTGVREGEPASVLRGVSEIADRLPPAVGRRVAGTAQRFDDRPLIAGFEPDRDGATECWVLTTAQAKDVWSNTRTVDGFGGSDGVFVSGLRTTEAWATLGTTDGSWVELVAQPVLPHGGFVLWGG